MSVWRWYDSLIRLCDSTRRLTESIRGVVSVLEHQHEAPAGWRHHATILQFRWPTKIAPRSGGKTTEGNLPRDCTTQIERPRRADLRRAVSSYVHASWRYLAARDARLFDRACTRLFPFDPRQPASQQSGSHVSAILFVLSRRRRELNDFSTSSFSFPSSPSHVLASVVASSSRSPFCHGLRSVCIVSGSAR